MLSWVSSEGLFRPQELWGNRLTVAVGPMERWNTMENSITSQRYVGRATLKRISDYFDQYHHSWGMRVYDDHRERWHEYNISRFRENWALDMIKNEPKKVAVDLGCGIGHMLVMLKRMGYGRVVGIDISKNMLTEAQQFLGINGLTGEIELHRADVQDLRMIGSRSIDVCTALGVIEYQDEDGPLLREVNRILKPGGAAVIQMRNYNCVYTRTSRLLQTALRRLPPRISYREHRPRQVRAEVPKYGFAIEKEYFSHFYAMYPLNVVPKVNRLIRPFDNYLSKHCESLSGHHMSRVLASMYITLLRKESDL